MTEAAGRHAKYPEMQALWALTQGRQLARELAAVGVDQLLVLRGPELQHRLFATPARYMSADLDLLVRRRAFRRVRTALRELGFTPHSSDRIGWPFAMHGKYERRGFAVDLHSDLRLWPYPGWSFHRLASQLWQEAQVGESGYLEPSLDALTVYLAAHAASRGFEPPVLASLAPAAAARVDDKSEIRRIAAESRLTGVVEGALGNEGARRVVDPGLLRDGRGSGEGWRAWRWVRTAIVPRGVRDRVHEYVAYRRHDLAVIRPRRETRVVAVPSELHRAGTAASIEIQVWEGVLGPGPSAGSLVASWLRAAQVGKSEGRNGRSEQRSEAPVLVEVGTGTGILAIMVKRAAPDASVVATDIASRAVRNARANAARIGLPITVHRGDLLAPLPASLRGNVDAILAHLPSLPPSGPVDERARGAESLAPREASHGPGGDGLGLVRRLVRMAPPWLGRRGALVLTLQSWQWDLLTPEVMAAGFELVSREPISAHLSITTLRQGTPPDLVPEAVHQDD